MDVFDLQGRISLDSSDLSKGLKKSEQGMKEFGDKMSNSFDKLKSAAKWLVGGYAAKQVTSFVKNALDMRGSLEQSLGGAEAVFGDFWVFVNQEAKKAYETLGLSQNEYLETANRIGSLMQGSGFSAQEAAETSIKVMQRASDVASIMGIDVTDAMTAISGAAKGNFTMMDNLGVAMNATSLEAYALEKGITKSYNAMTQAEKIGLAYDMFLEKTAKYAGNYAKENDTYAGSINTLSAAWENFMTGEGTADAVVESALRAGKVIYKNLKILVPSLARGFGDIIKTAIKKIKWPTWADVKKFASGKWNDIVKGVANLGGLIFGKNEEGKVNWPSFSEAVEWARVNIWEGIIQKGVKDFGGLVFGKDENGEVNWPKDFNEAFKWFEDNIWIKVKNWAKTLGGIVFGNKENGEVDWPSVEDVRKKAQKFWTGEDGQGGVIGATKDIFNFVFGLDNPDAEGQANEIGRWWKEEVTPLLGTVFDYTLALFGLPSAKDMADKINSWLDQVVADIHDAPLKLLDGIFGTNLAEQAEEARKQQEAIFSKDENGMTWAEKHNIASQAASDAEELAGEFAEQYEAYLASIPPMQIPMTYDEFVLQELQKKVDEISGNHTINFNIGVNGTIPGAIPGFDFKPKAKGEYYVPYNDYPALLHEGEMVLTRTQADKYRKGEGQDGGSTVARAVQRLENTLANLQLVVDGKEFGRASVNYGGSRMNDYIGKADNRIAAGYGS